MLLRFLVLLLSASLLLPYVAFAFDSRSYAAEAWEENSISIPKTLGTITDAHEANSKTVIVIQDLHCNEEVQKEIAGIIGHLVTRHHLKLVAEEGAFHAVDVSALGTFPIPEIRKEVGDYLVRQGKITGAEYYAGVSGRPIRIQGMDSPELYQASLDAVQGFLTNEIQGCLYDLRDILSSLQTRLSRKNQLQTFKTWQTRLNIMEKLLNISATPKELRFFRSERHKFTISAFLDFYHQTLPKEQLPAEVRDLAPLGEALRRAGRFYQLTDQRSRVFVDNLLSAMDRDREQTAVMITGGFHAARVMAALKARGVSCLSVKPHVTKTNAANPYFSLLQGRKTLLEKWLAHDQNTLALRNGWEENQVLKHMIVLTASLLYKVGKKDKVHVALSDGQAEALEDYNRRFKLKLERLKGAGLPEGIRAYTWSFHGKPANRDRMVLAMQAGLPLNVQRLPSYDKYPSGTLAYFSSLRKAIAVLKDAALVQKTGWSPLSLVRRAIKMAQKKPPWLILGVLGLLTALAGLPTGPAAVPIGENIGIEGALQALSVLEAALLHQTHSIVLWLSALLILSSGFPGISGRTVAWIVSNHQPTLSSLKSGVAAWMSGTPSGSGGNQKQESPMTIKDILEILESVRMGGEPSSIQAAQLLELIPKLQSISDAGVPVLQRDVDLAINNPAELLSLVFHLNKALDYEQQLEATAYREPEIAVRLLSDNMMDAIESGPKGQVWLPEAISMLGRLGTVPALAALILARRRLSGNGALELLIGKAIEQARQQGTEKQRRFKQDLWVEEFPQNETVKRIIASRLLQTTKQSKLGLLTTQDLNELRKSIAKMRLIDEWQALKEECLYAIADMNCYPFSSKLQVSEISSLALMTVLLYAGRTNSYLKNYFEQENLFYGMKPNILPVSWVVEALATDMRDLKSELPEDATLYWGIDAIATSFNLERVFESIPAWEKFRTFWGDLQQQFDLMRPYLLEPYESTAANIGLLLRGLKVLPDKWFALFGRLEKLMPDSQEAYAELFGNIKHLFSDVRILVAVQDEEAKQAALEEKYQALDKLVTRFEALFRAQPKWVELLLRSKALPSASQEAYADLFGDIKRLFSEAGILVADQDEEDKQAELEEKYQALDRLITRFEALFRAQPKWVKLILRSKALPSASQEAHADLFGDIKYLFSDVRILVAVQDEEAKQAELEEKYQALDKLITELEALSTSPERPFYLWKATVILTRLVDRLFGILDEQEIRRHAAKLAGRFEPFAILAVLPASLLALAHGLIGVDISMPIIIAAELMSLLAFRYLHWGGVYVVEKPSQGVTRIVFKTWDQLTTASKIKRSLWVSNLRYHGLYFVFFSISSYFILAFGSVNVPGFITVVAGLLLFFLPAVRKHGAYQASVLGHVLPPTLAGPFMNMLLRSLFRHIQILKHQQKPAAPRRMLPRPIFINAA